MQLSPYHCHECKKPLFVTDNTVTATITRDGIYSDHIETGNKELTIHWCELCADGVTDLTLVKGNA